MTPFASRTGTPDSNPGAVAAPYAGPERRRRITVLLVTNQLALGDAFRPSLDHYRAVHFVNALAATAAQMNEAIERRMPRILLLDEKLLRSLGPRAVGAITADHPRLRVLLVSDRENPDMLDTIVRNRFHGILKTTAPAEVCVKALFKVNRGEYWLPRKLMEQALFAPQAAADSLGTAIDEKLSRREADAVRHLCSGMTNRQIAEALGIREDTVKKHLHKAYAKLGVQNRTQLIASLTSRAGSEG